MRQQQHPITPSPELVQQWLGEFFGCTVSGELSDSERFLATQAAQWGADQELEACCEWLDREGWSGESRQLRAARRPKPPSLKEQAMQALCRFMASEDHEDCTEEEVADDFTTIRHALEQLPDNE
jgi:hypothetical protein